MNNPSYIWGGDPRGYYTNPTPAKNWMSNATGAVGLLGQAGRALMPLAIAGSGASLAYWATTNLMQTKQISKDQALQRELQRQQIMLDREMFEYEQEQDVLDYEHEMEQIHTIAAYDSIESQIQSNSQYRSQQFEASLYNAKQQQLAIDRKTFLKDQAFKELGSSQTFGNSEPIEKIAYILTELHNIKNQNIPVSAYEEFNNTNYERTDGYLLPSNAVND